MTLVEMKKLLDKFLEDADNRADYNAYLLDKNIILFNKVVYYWVKNQVFDEIKSKTISIYIIENL